MKSLLIVAVILAGTAVPAIGQEEPAELELRKKLSVSLSTELWDKYMLDGYVFSEDPVIQTSLTIGLPQGFFVNLWSSIGLDDSDLSSNFGDELDYSVGWAGQVSEKLTLELGVSYFDLVDIGKFEFDILDIYGKLSTEIKKGEKHTLSPYFELEYMIAVDWPGADNGFLFNAGLYHSYRLGEKWSLESHPKFFYDTGAILGDNGLFFELFVGPHWQANERIGISPIMLRWAAPITDVDDGRESRVAIGFGASFNF